MSNAASVRVTSEGRTLRQSLVVVNVGNPQITSLPLYVWGTPRVFFSATQTVGAVAGAMDIEWAIRDGVNGPEWLPLQTVTLSTTATVNTLAEIGAVWVRVTVRGALADNVELAISAFV